MMEQRERRAKCLSILGTGSDVGKSIVVTALCRIFRGLGVSVAPFKAQNMSNNSFVTKLGGEMGRAQIVQAEAAGVEPHVDMNPVLLKPCKDIEAQVILHGKPVGNRVAKEYFNNTDDLFSAAKGSLERLCSTYDLVVIEGAGSCAEVNLRDREFVNFPMAHEVNAPVILVADIDRGGVFAQVIGTLEVISEEDRRTIQGVIINRFRGDPTLFDEGIEYLERRTGIPVLGLVPFFHHIEIDSEDGLPLDILLDPLEVPKLDRINIAVLRFPHISNFTDFNPLEREDGVILHYLAKPRNLEGYNIVILPGTKNVRSDMDWLRETGWEKLLCNYIENGGELGGICGGYQMLGGLIRDPDGVEGERGETIGLGLLDMETTLHHEKILCNSTGIWNMENEQVEGYEIHNGITTQNSVLPAAIRVISRNRDSASDHDGAITSDGKIWGTYFHGLFDRPGFRYTFLRRFKPDYKPKSEMDKTESVSNFKERQYRLLADHFSSHLDMSKLLGIVGMERNV